MSDLSYTRRFAHPYQRRSNALYDHFRDTRFTHQPRAAAAVPFAWVMKNDKEGLPPAAKRLGLGFRPELEPDLGFETKWVQERRNQLVMLDTFFGAVVPQASLVFFYAKRTPLTDDPKRVIVGIGRVLKVGPSVEYAYNGPPSNAALRSMVWERNVHHSITDDGNDGFLLPYSELLLLREAQPDLDLAPLVLHAPEEHWDAFSMGSEHVTHDTAVGVLIAAALMAERYEKLLGSRWAKARHWIDAELNRLWRLRGPFPGLGSALTALGLEHGTLLAYAIGDRIQSISGAPKDPWSEVEHMMSHPELLPSGLAKSIGPIAAKLWSGLQPDRRALLKLLARFEVTGEQAKRWWVREERSRAGIVLEDSELLANPYLLYEADRDRLDGIPFATIDRGMFPGADVLSHAPIPEPSRCAEPLDPRRGRALMVQILETSSHEEGHTVLPEHWLIQRVRDADLAPACNIGGDWVRAFSNMLSLSLTATSTHAGHPAWQLERYAAAREQITTRIQRRLTGKRHVADVNWRGYIDEALGGPLIHVDVAEEGAREEKAAALQELFQSRVTALIGPAGTGKTTLLLALLSLSQVRNGGVLLLAPTGKARVQMQKKAGVIQAFTLAQFLLTSGRYSSNTGAYRATNRPDREAGFATVIIDEASMLTEDQLAATLDAIDPTRVQRLILVGDPRQLPPIGAGRPFIDIIRNLREQTSTPQHGLAELTIVRRQALTSDASNAQRDDVLLSQWFSGESPDAGADEVWSRVADGTAIGVRAVRWDTPSDLQRELLALITHHVRKGASADCSDETAFEASLGGSEYKGRAYFKPSWIDANGQRIGGAASVEAWQVLAPLRTGESGVDGLNRWIKSLFRLSVRNWAEPDVPWHRKVVKPLGPQAILYGDKVINLSNGRRTDVFPELDNAYIANGEIGLVVGQYKGQNWKPNRLPWKLEVEFATQLGYKFGFYPSDFGGLDGDQRLELAYALTLHKAQGSEFGTTFVVIPNPCRPLSRELLYTALTRQQKDVVVLHQGDLRDLLKFATSDRSETAKRLTNLFRAPEPLEHASVFLESSLVHRTARGELVRSKSEVIVADLLDGLGVSYSYEQPFTGYDGTLRYPDFTVDDGETGRRIFVEHLGMLDKPEYVRRWEAKLEWYRRSGVKLFNEGDAEVSLVTTTELGGFDAARIRQQLREALAI